MLSRPWIAKKPLKIDAKPLKLHGQALDSGPSSPCAGTLPNSRPQIRSDYTSDAVEAGNVLPKGSLVPGSWQQAHSGTAPMARKAGKPSLAVPYIYICLFSYKHYLIYIYMLH